ncbi:MAG: hypothetical protein LIP04_11130 [Tannerellaceae bacterium]|nr:hypothetical protein [Tannerellaceae bacterium]
MAFTYIFLMAEMLCLFWVIPARSHTMPSLSRKLLPEGMAGNCICIFPLLSRFRVVLLLIASSGSAYQSYPFPQYQRTRDSSEDSISWFRGKIYKQVNGFFSLYVFQSDQQIGIRIQGKDEWNWFIFG